MLLDVQRARRDTPGCDEVLHFNNAGAALMPSVVGETVIEHLREEMRRGGYEAARAAGDRLDKVYDSAARLLNCRREEIAVVENATRAWDMAFYSFDFRPGDRILTSVSEYASNFIALLQVAERTGAVVEVVPNDRHGQFSVEALSAMLDERVRLVAVTHVPSNGGLVNPIEEIGAVTRKAGVMFMVDACQSVGQLELDVERIGCDVLSATSRKYLRGPRGCGLLYVRRRLVERLTPPFLDLHAAEWVSPARYEIRNDARRFENWESNVAGVLGMGAAIDYALSWGLPAIERRVTRLAEFLRARLERIPGVTLRDLGKKKCGIVSFTVGDRDPVEVRDALASRGINVWCSPASGTLLDMTQRKLTSVVRASVHYYNDDAEIDRFTAAIECVVR